MILQIITNKTDYLLCLTLQLSTSVASTSVASVSGCQVPQLPVSLAAKYLSCQCPCVSCWYLYISCQCLDCWYLNCQCLCLSCWCLRSVPWLPKMSSSQLLRTAVRQLSRIPMSHQHRCPVGHPRSMRSGACLVYQNVGGQWYLLRRRN